MLKKKPWLRTILILIGALALVGLGMSAGYLMGRASIANGFAQNGGPRAFLQGGDGQDLPEGFQETAEAFRDENSGQGFPGDFQGGGLNSQQPGGGFGGSALPWLLVGAVLVVLLVFVLVLALRPSPVPQIRMMSRLIAISDKL